MGIVCEFAAKQSNNAEKRNGQTNDRPGGLCLYMRRTGRSRSLTRFSICDYIISFGFGPAVNECALVYFRDE